MAIHKNLAEAELHEPKGMSLLTGGASDVGKVPVSKGDGTTETRLLTRGELSDYVEEYGQQTITNNSTVVAFTAAVDPTLATNTDYIQITGIFDAVPHGETNGVTQQTNQLTVATTGIYRIEVWADTSSSINSTVVGLKFAINGTIGVGRRPRNLMRNVGEVNNMSAHGLIALNAGDVLTLWGASDKTANVTFHDAVFMVTLVRKTA